MSTAAELLLRLNRSLGTALLIALRAITAALIIGTLVLPANAQFWGDSWGGRQQPQQRQQPYNPFGGFGVIARAAFGASASGKARDTTRARESELGSRKEKNRQITRALRLRRRARMPRSKLW